MQHTHTHTQALSSTFSCSSFCYVSRGTTRWPLRACWPVQSARVCVSACVSVCVRADAWCIRPLRIILSACAWGAMALREPAEFWPASFHDLQHSYGFLLLSILHLSAATAISFVYHIETSKVSSNSSCSHVRHVRQDAAFKYKVNQFYIAL